jgi:hypothetical protein
MCKCEGQVSLKVAMGRLVGYTDHMYIKVDIILSSEKIPNLILMADFMTTFLPSALRTRQFRV